MGLITRISTVFTGLPGLPGVSHLYFAADTQAEAADAHAKVSLMWNDLKGGQDSDLTMTVDGQMSLIDDSDGSTIDFFNVTPTSYAGALTSTQELPLAAQLLMRFKTAGVVHNRRVQGHIFVPGYTITASVGGQVNASTAGTILGIVNTRLNSASTGQMIWSRPFAGKTGNPARVGSSYAVSSRAIGTQWAVLRSRRP